ncbi:hypothetical protein [Pteropox virus]|uniref:Uncharacterized protein n=1 Tax=Pteropox virus TaxID=1873698 RepID=A0A1B1MR88_9POXV|nr:hypothetical protein [Pteropox virus]ANS71106.1 hypothetical protein [Pteropox virus]
MIDPVEQDSLVDEGMELSEELEELLDSLEENSDLSSIVSDSDLESLIDELEDFNYYLIEDITH